MRARLAFDTSHMVGYLRQKQSRSGTLARETAAEVGDKAFKRSQDYCPVKSGALKRSGKVEQRQRGFFAEVSIVYGGATAPYSVYVHEGTKYMTGRKWVERAIKDTAPELEVVGAKKLKQELRG